MTDPLTVYLGTSGNRPVEDRPGPWALAREFAEDVARGEMLNDPDGVACVWQGEVDRDDVVEEIDGRVVVVMRVHNVRLIGMAPVVP